MDFSNLELVIERQLTSYEANGLSGKIKFGTKIYPKTVLRDSLLLLRDLTIMTKTCMKSFLQEVCMKNFNQEMNKRFAIYKPIPGKSEQGYRKTKTTQYTSYYSPDLTGSRVKTERYNHPIYGQPTNPADQNYTRVQIDYKGALDGKGYELFYVEDSYYDLYLLHVQGGGRIKIINADGTTEFKYLSYAGKNSRTFQMIYRYMIEKGYLEGDASIPAQRRFLAEHPEKLEEIFDSCPSYVYFKESDHEPLGLDNIPLTENRSLAIDNHIYKTTGMINFVKTLKPVSVDQDGKIVKAPFSRFFISQDTGGAIRGNARCDLYAGYGTLAELSAYNTNELGEQYFLIKN
jgi:membrane-bound lytic murein transglycosylase A